MRAFAQLLLAAVVTASLLGAASAASLSNDQVRDLMIKESLASYPGNCPCPYNVASNGSQCGKRSAWSKPGGYDPLCYRADITDAMVSGYRAQHGL